MSLSGLKFEFVTLGNRCAFNCQPMTLLVECHDNIHTLLAVYVSCMFISTHQSTKYKFPIIVFSIKINPALSATANKLLMSITDDTGNESKVTYTNLRKTKT